MENVVQSGGFQTFLSQDPFTLLKIIKPTQEILFTWAVYLLICIVLEIKTEEFLKLVHYKITKIDCVNISSMFL